MSDATTYDLSQKGIPPILTCSEHYQIGNDTNTTWVPLFAFCFFFLLHECKCTWKCKANKCEWIVFRFTISYGINDATDQNECNLCRSTVFVTTDIQPLIEYLKAFLLDWDTTCERSAHYCTTEEKACSDKCGTFTLTQRSERKISLR